MKSIDTTVGADIKPVPLSFKIPQMMTMVEDNISISTITISAIELNTLCDWAACFPDLLLTRPYQSTNKKRFFLFFFFDFILFLGLCRTTTVLSHPPVFVI